MKRMMRIAPAFVACATFSFGCGGNAPAPPATCDQACMDGIALRGLRAGMRFAFNFAIATKPVGKQDVMAPCIPSGSVHIVGDAESNAMLGTSQIDLTYTMTDCKIPAPQSTTPDRNYNLIVNGVVNEKGELAMGGPTTALVFTGMGLIFTGSKVYDPPQDYDEPKPMEPPCTLSASQDGNNVAGTLCGRMVKGFSGF
jgi:hypothetical protein